MHTPPPVHGSSVVGGYIKTSKVINAAFKCKFVNFGTSYSVKEIGKKNPLKIFRYLLILLNTLHHLIFFRPSLCYIAITAKGSAFFKDAVVAILCKLFFVPVIYHFHNKGVKTKEHKRLYNLAYKIVFKKSSVILLSKNLYADIKKYVPEKDVYYCPNGIPDINPDFKKHPISSQKAVSILFFSNLIESKGVYTLLEACNHLTNKKVDYKCKFVGGEGDISAEALEKRIRNLNLESNVSYEGKIIGKSKEGVFKSSDILVLPSFNDCFPLVIIEAMQYAIPVISTYEGGIPELISDGVTGYLVEPKDYKMLANRIELLIGDALLRQKMGQKGREKYQKYFMLNQFETRLTEILKKQIDK